MPDTWQRSRSSYREWEPVIRHRIHFIVLTAACLPLIASSALAETTVHDAAADWSNTQNPNGVWTYTGNNGAILSTNQPDWDPAGAFFSGQRAWSNAILPEPDHVPMWFRSEDASALDAPGLGMHGSEGAIDAWVGIVWRSPVDGTATLRGGVWQALKTTIGAYGGNHRNRNSDWRLRHNHFILASGNVSGTDSHTSASPQTFAAQAAVPSLENVPVAAGDEIVLEFISPTSYASFIGIELVITTTTSD